MLASEYRYTYLRTIRTASLFKNFIVRQILISSGNIPVDRKNKDRRGLFQGTIEALSHGSVVALFPEGTSYTEPRIMQVKDGASWAALEYTKWAHENPSRATKDPLVIVPSAIVYTNKSKYRSYVRYVAELLHRYTRSDSVFIGHSGVRPLDNPYPATSVLIFRLLLGLGHPFLWIHILNNFSLRKRVHLGRLSNDSPRQSKRDLWNSPSMHLTGE